MKATGKPLLGGNTRKRKYVQRVRADRKVMNDLRRNAETILKFEEREERKAEAAERRKRRLKRRKRSRGYTAPNAEGVSRKDKENSKRLAALPANRTCPCCKKIKLKSAQWTIVKGEALCKSCWSVAQGSVADWKSFFADREIIEWICKNLSQLQTTGT